MAKVQAACKLKVAAHEDPPLCLTKHSRLEGQRPDLGLVLVHPQVHRQLAVLSKSMPRFSALSLACCHIDGCPFNLLDLCASFAALPAA
jgi:hypothetical protein